MPDAVESRADRVERMLARLVPQLVDELSGLYYYLEHLPQSLQPEARNRAASLRTRMARIHNLMEDAHGDPEREAAGRAEVEELKPALREERTGDASDEFYGPPRGTGRGSRD